MGKTGPEGEGTNLKKKHPHGRGEDVTRGEHRRKTNGNTPTGVGKTPSPSLVASMIQKPPHGRGEDFLARLMVRDSVETPPRAWGRQARFADDGRQLRNTPTGVGKT